MLNELLVLGQVPGSDFQITFNEMLMTLDIAFLIYFVAKRRLSINKFKHPIAYMYLYLTTKKGQQLELFI